MNKNLLDVVGDFVVVRDGDHLLKGTVQKTELNPTGNKYPSRIIRTIRAYKENGQWIQIEFISPKD